MKNNVRKKFVYFLLVVSGTLSFFSPLHGAEHYGVPHAEHPNSLLAFNCLLIAAGISPIGPVKCYFSEKDIKKTVSFKKTSTNFFLQEQKKTQAKVRLQCSLCQEKHLIAELSKHFYRCHPGCFPEEGALAKKGVFLVRCTAAECSSFFLSTRPRNENTSLKRHLLKSHSGIASERTVYAGTLESEELHF